MQKYLVWYWILLKAQIRKISTWVQVLFLIAVCFLINETVIPTSDCKIISILNCCDEVGEELVRRLNDSDTMFAFQMEESKEALKKAVETGSVDCGFIIEPELKEQLKTGGQEKGITYIKSTYTSKGSIAKETIYAQYLNMLSEKLIEVNQQQIFRDSSKEIKDFIDQHNREYLSGNELFAVELLHSSKASDLVEMENKRYCLVYGVTGLIIFASILFCYSENIQKVSCRCASYRVKREKRRFLALQYSASITFITLASYIYLGILFGHWLQNLLCMIGFLGYSFLWGSLYAKLFHRNDTYAPFMIAILLLNIIVCPMFWDLQKLIPALRYVKGFFPLGAYLRVLECFIY